MFSLHIPPDLTVDDLMALPSGYRYELHEGNLVVMSPANMWHSKTSFRLNSILRATGHVAYQEVGIKFGRRDSRAADVVVFTHPPDESRAFFSPHEILIAIEIVSPSTEDGDRIYKPQHYARAGIPEYWRVERADSDDDALIYKHELARTADGRSTYVQTEMVRLSQLEKEQE